MHDIKRVAKESATAKESTWPRGSIGRHISQAVPTALLGSRADAVLASIKERSRTYDSIHYIYLLGPERTFEGVISFRELFALSPDALIQSTAQREKLVTVYPEEHERQAAGQAFEHHLEGIPVIDHGGHFLGAVPHDVIVSILYRSLHRDILGFSGVHHGHQEYDSAIDVPVLSAVRHRIPWLLFGLLGGVFAASTISFFEGTLEQNIILASFIPLVVYIADAVGIQLEAIAIRDFAFARKLNIVKYMWIQLRVVLVVALILASIIGLFGFAISGRLIIGGVLTFAVFIACVSSVFFGLLVPLVLRRFRKDPVVGSGPLRTIIQDVFSVVIYFLVATALL